MKIFYVILLLVLIFLYILAYYNIFRYTRINMNPTSKFSSNYGKLPRVKKKGKVIISLTTVPGRIETSKYSLASLLDQTQRVDEIRFYIPLESSKGEPYIIPEWMTNLSKNVKQFIIKRCVKDWGPATKIIPAVLDSQREDIDSIIYVDDDIIYNKNMVETLVSYSKRYPKYAICNQGWNVERWIKNSKILQFFHHTRKYFPRSEPFYHNFTDVMQGFSGVLIKPSFFDISALVNIKKYQKEVFFVDDVYLSGLLNNNGIHRITTDIQSGIPFWSEFYNGFLMRAASHSLSSEHNNDLRNDKIASKCFTWYKQVIIKVNNTN